MSTDGERMGPLSFTGPAVFQGYELVEVTVTLGGYSIEKGHWREEVMDG